MMNTNRHPTSLCSRAIAMALLLCSLLVACASLIGPQTHEIPLTRLQEGLDRRIANTRRVLPLFDIQLARPVLTTLPEQGRISLSLSPTISPTLMSQSWSGTLLVSGQLVIDAKRNSVNLIDARVERFVFEGVDGEHLRLIAKVLNSIADTVFKDMPLVSFRPEELRIAGVQFVPTGIQVTATSLLVTLEPAK